MVEGVRDWHNYFPGLFRLPMIKAQFKLAKAKTKEERRNLWTHFTEKAGSNGSNNVVSIS